MDRFAQLEAQPHVHIPKVIGCLCGPNEAYVAQGLAQTDVDSLKMSLSIYTKNVSANLLKA